MVGDKHNVLVHYKNVCSPDQSGVVVCNPFKWDVLCSFLIENHAVFCVPAITEKWIFPLNYRNRKVVGDTQDVLIHYVDISAPNLFGVVLWNHGTLLYEILCGCGLMFLLKNHVCLCVPTTTGKMNSIPQPQEQKSGRRTQCSSTPCECLCTLPIWYCCLNPFYMRYIVVHFDWKSCCLLCTFHNSGW